MGKLHQILVNYLIPISNVLKGWDSILYEYKKEFLLMIESRIYKPSKRNMGIAMCQYQNQTRMPNINPLDFGAAI
jgi:hypothetical protein